MFAISEANWIGQKLAQPTMGVGWALSEFVTPGFGGAGLLQNMERGSRSAATFLPMVAFNACNLEPTALS
jgi:hypothetical protein